MAKIETEVWPIETKKYIEHTLQSTYRNWASPILCPKNRTQNWLHFK